MYAYASMRVLDFLAVLYWMMNVKWNDKNQKPKPITKTNGSKSFTELRKAR
jgi:hypothetical protein